MRFTAPSFWTTAACVGLLLGHAPVARADVVQDWNAILLNTPAGPPFPASRVAAMTQLAVFEAVNAIVGDYDSYLASPLPAAAGASAEAAAAAAAHKVLITLVPAQAATLNAALAATLLDISDGQSESDGIAVGVAAANAILTMRQGDGSTPPESYLPATSNPGAWQLTFDCPPTGGSFAHWGRVRTFGLLSGDQFRPGPPPSLNTGKYAEDFAELARVGAVDSVRPADRTDVALFYARLSPVVWANRAAAQVATSQGASLSENARALALLNMAIADAAVATFEAKYHYNFWRPETAIHEAATDGNPNTHANLAFVPLVSAPCFPGYPSNHATLTYAAREILERLYGPAGHDISLSTTLLPGVVLNYSTFKAISRDVDDARVYGGIHFRFDQEAGGKLGTTIAAYMVTHYLRPVRP
jgi:hypothetical protein